jgi:ABC-type antimicrobial peptide transport system permease subunit
MALGARPFLLVRLLISEIALVVGLGVLAGLAGGFGLGHYVTSLLYEVKPGNSATIVLPLLGLMLGCLLATLPPALRAMRVDPVVALRQE